MALVPSAISYITRVSRHQKGITKTNLDFLEQETEWQGDQLSHMQICTLPQTETTTKTENQASTPPLSFFTGGMTFLSPNQALKYQYLQMSQKI